MRRQHLALTLAGVALLGLAAYASWHSGAMRRAWILRFQMHEAAPGVMVKDSISWEQERSFVQLAADGRMQAEAWFGPLQNRASLVMVHDNDFRLDLSMASPFAWNPLEQGNRRAFIGPRGLNVDVVAHAIAHAEIKARAGLEHWPRLPAWFDEGLATQVDGRPFLRDLPAADAAPPSAEALLELSHTEAFSGDHGETNLIISKRVVTDWLQRSGGRAAADTLLAAVREGEDFNAVFTRLEARSAP